MPNIKEALKKVTETTSAKAYDENNPKLVFTNDPKTTDRVMITSYAGIDAERLYDDADILSRASRFVPDRNSPWAYVDMDTIAVGDSYTYNDPERGQVTDFYQPEEPIFSYYTRTFLRYAGSTSMNIKGMFAKGYYDFTNASLEITGTDSNFKTLRETQEQSSGRYRFESNGNLMSSTDAINAEITKISTGGGTPTVPAIDDAIKQYEAIKNNDGGMANNRKTVFLLITDGVANGYRDPNNPSDSTVYFDRSFYRTYSLMKDWGTNGRWPEAAQNYLARANELADAGNKLKAAAGANGKVAVGFWEDKQTLEAFDTRYGYMYAYENAFGDPDSRTTIKTGDPRSVREVFSTALQSVASGAETLPNGKDANYYVQESDINAFAANILQSLTSAITKQDVLGNFTITDGYKVKSVSINGKKIVDKVTNEATEIRGTVTQEGTKVTISVPDTVFKSGDNKFDYELEYSEASQQADVANEIEVPANYVPQKKNYTIGKLVGTFQVRTYTTAEIGKSAASTISVEDLQYCYPRATKDVKDKDISNDTNGDDGKTGTIAEDPLLKSADPSISRPTYAATLSDQGEAFTYKVRYNMYNGALAMNNNVMFVDALNYHVDYVDAHVEGESGKTLPDFKVSTKQSTDAAGKPITIVYATVPPLKGPNESDTVTEGNYGGHKFKVYNLVINAKIKDQYSFENNPDEYKKMMTDNGGLGFLSQAKIIWDGATADPEDTTAKLRRSNAVYVVPPVKTDISKKVTQDLNVAGTDHLELPTRLDAYYYQLNSTWSGLFDRCLIEDTLVPELMSLHDEKSEDKVLINGKEATTLAKYLKEEVVQVNGVSRDRVYFELDASKLSRLELRQINTEIEALNKGNNGPAIITLGIQARVRDNAVLAKYADANGKIKIPNTANVTLNNNSQTSNKVTVSPNSPAAIKLINGDDTHIFSTVDGNEAGVPFNYDVQATLPNVATKTGIKPNGESHVITTPPVTVTPPQEDPTVEKMIETPDTKELVTDLDIENEKVYNYIVTSQLPADIQDFKKFVIKDTLDDRLTALNTADNKPFIEGDAAKFFDVKVDGQTVTATMKEFITATDSAGKEIKLVIPAQINKGVKTPQIPNTASIDFTNAVNKQGNRKTEPVTVSPPGETPTVEKKINGTLTDALVLPESNYTYNIKALLPMDITSYKAYTIVDEVNENLASKIVELVITAQVKATSTEAKIENTAKVTYQNKSHVDGTPDSETPPTPPVTGTPPPLTKKINDTLDHLDTATKTDYKYNIKTTLPTDIATYKTFVIKDTLEKELEVQGPQRLQGTRLSSSRLK
ncbi:isopeptide-forming domain-containing fimbrial protein [Streptococcus sp. X16XC17]|uniref:isopeptide-forming domain-containing fimbrial protein n=1 Tax=Streptococcus sp. X16XC17 TaxID=2316646 RepID=UPI00103FF776|nr:isopeptide-forming domain-containing fimbrial protein [Streptococcus sp. X16XC17]